MNKLRLFALALALAALSACIPSVNPFYTSEDLSFDSRLVGRWLTKASTDKVEAWEFEPEGDRGYKLKVQTFRRSEGEQDPEAKQGSFSAHLFKLKDELFLDIVPTDCDFAPKLAELAAAAMMPGHLLIRVPQIEPELKLASCDYDWLEKHLQKNPDSLAHRQQGNRILLTAGTRSLQRFIRRHGREGELFQPATELVRQPAAAASEESHP